MSASIFIFPCAAQQVKAPGLFFLFPTLIQQVIRVDLIIRSLRQRKGLMCICVKEKGNAYNHSSNCYGMAFLVSSSVSFTP